MANVFYLLCPVVSANWEHPRFSRKEAVGLSQGLQFYCMKIIHMANVFLVFRAQLETERVFHNHTSTDRMHDNMFAIWEVEPGNSIPVRS